VTGFTQTGTTASGLPAGPGVAACPPDWPLGTRIVVEGYGPATCLDRYAPYLSRRVDLWTPTAQQAFALTGWREVALADNN